MMKKTTQNFPLPGIAELERVVNGFARCLKKIDCDEFKRDLIAERLETLMSYACQLEEPMHLISEVQAIQKRFELAFKPISFRLDLLQAERRLMIWDEANLKISGVIERSMLQLMSQIRYHQIKNSAAICLDYIKLSTVRSYEIAEQKEVHLLRQHTTPHPWFDTPPQVNVQSDLVSCRSGWLRNVPVVYKLFQGPPGESLNEIVNQEMENISQSLHLNVAAIVGATAGTNGLNGLVVSMAGMPISEFASRTNSASIWIKCLDGIKAASKSVQFRYVELITVTPDGHATVLPSCHSGISTILLLLNPSLPLQGSCGSYPTITDMAVKTLLRVYSENSNDSGAQFQLFMDDCREQLGFGFLEINVFRIAAACDIVPLRTRHRIQVPGQATPVLTIRAGDAIRVLKCSTKNTAVGWNWLTQSHLTDTQSLLDQVWLVDRTETYPMERISINPEWASFVVGRIPSGASSGGDQIVRLDIGSRIQGALNSPWSNFTSEAESIARRTCIPLEDISLCDAVFHALYMKAPANSVKPDPNKVLYFHRNVNSNNAWEFWGFISASPNPLMFCESLDSYGWAREIVMYV